MPWTLLAWISLVLASSAHSRPLILVEGGGPPLVTDLSQLGRRFEATGWPRRDIHFIKYAHRKPLPEVNQQVASQIRQIKLQYLPSQKFDFVTHSMGQFVALYTLLEEGLSPMVHTYVGLAGVAHGQDAGALASLWIGPMARWLSPFKNLFLTDFYQRHRSALAQFEKCSFYSPQDKFVSRPHDSGAFPGGTNVSLPKVGHLEIVKSRKVFLEILRQCSTLRPHLG